MQPETRQVRQASGARPGGTSLEAETEAVLAGLRLVPGGAVARLYSDLAPAALLELVQGPVGEAAWVHLRDLWLHPIARNSNRHHLGAHRVARAAEQEARQGTFDGSGLSNAALDMQDLARSGAADPPLALHPPRPLPGTTGPLQVRVRPVAEGAVTRGGRGRVTLTLDLPAVPGSGRNEEEAVRDALTRALTPLARGGLVTLTVPPRWTQAAADATRDLGVVRVVPEGEG